jgi:hypothetical protein
MRFDFIDFGLLRLFPVDADPLSGWVWNFHSFALFTLTLKMVAEFISETSTVFTHPRSEKTQKQNYNREI